MSDGSVTQYRNKSMFYILASKLQDKNPNVALLLGLIKLLTKFNEFIINYNTEEMISII